MTNNTFRDRLLASTVFAGVALLGATGATAQNDPQSGANPAAPVIGGSSSAAVPTVAPTNTDASGNAQAGEQGVIVVTGSRIASANLSSVSPVTVVSNQEFKLQGTTRVEDLINNLPQAFADQGGNVSNGSTGTATVNLRNLGASRTLVLINGKRLLPGDPSDSSADLNNVPAALVERVDVLTGGASSVYGSDAIAGVVNFVMNKNFEGFRIDAQYSLFQHDNHTGSDVNNALAGRNFTAPQGNVVDGATKDITAVLGVNTGDGKGNATVYATYRKISAVLQRDRDYSSCSLAESGSAFSCSGSSTSFPGRFILNGGSGASVTIDPAAPNGNGFRPYVGTRDAFNFAPYNYYQRPDERYSLGAFAHYEVSEAFDPYMELMFMDDRTVAQIAPSGIFLQPQTINCDNPLLSSGQRTAICGAVNGAGAGVAGTNGVVSIGRRNVEGGGRQDDLRHTSYRIVLGGRGKINDAFSYDVYGQFGRTIYAENYRNDFSLARTAQALNVVAGPNGPQCADATARAAGCVPYNIFATGGVTQGALNYLQTPGFKEGSTTEYVADASITGQLGEFGLQSPFAEEGVGFAIGTEYRKETLDLRTDAEFTTGDLAGQGGPTIGINGSFDVKEVFGELRLPLVSDKPFFHDLFVEAGYRYSDYNTGVKTNSYKLGGAWAPIDGFRFRGSYNRAVRAPNIQELFAAQSLSLFSGSDPCAGTAVGGLVNGNTAAQCARSGVTAAQFGNIVDSSANQYNQLSGGNPKLAPEKSDTYTAGILIAPTTFARGLVISVDAFRIKLNNQISTVGANLSLAQCIASGNPTFCSLVQRDPSNGSLFLGTVGRVVNTNVNVGGIKTQGIDVAASYRLDLDQFGMNNFGSLGFDFSGTYTDKFEVSPGSTASDGTTSYECRGYYGVTCGTPIPKWRHKLRVTLNTPSNFQISGNWRHVTSVRSDQTSTNTFLAGTTYPIDAKIGSRDYFDVAVAMRIAEKYSFRVGVNNVTDKDPPLIGSNSLSGTFGNGNTYPQVYDALGRYLYAGFTFDF